MNKPGYTLSIDYIAEVVKSRPDPSSPTGVSMNARAMTERFQKMGLDVKTNNKGGPQSASCRICGDVTSPSGSRSTSCNPALHNEYYERIAT